MGGMGGAFLIALRGRANGSIDPNDSGSVSSVSPSCIRPIGAMLLV